MKKLSRSLAVGPKGLMFADESKLKFFRVYGLFDDGRNFHAVLDKPKVSKNRKDKSFEEIISDLDAFQSTLKQWKRKRNTK